MDDDLWAIKSPSNKILPATIAVTPQGCWMTLAGGNGPSKEHIIVKDIGDGFTCVKVRIIEVEE